MNRAATAATLLLLMGCRERVGHGWDFGRMRHQPEARTFDSTSLFADGRVLRVPPAGTVSNDSGPIPASADTMRGAERYAIDCAVCHGARGDGQSVAAANYDPPRPPALLTDSMIRLGDSRIDSVIRFGFGTMPAFGATIRAADRAAIVAYLRTLQRTPR